MKIAEIRVSDAGLSKDRLGHTLYFGDGVWDKQACEKLGYNFILIGDKASHSLRINDFKSYDQIMMLLNKSLYLND